ncbi:hypothetical protein H9P43_005578 [Blastocladiella emersonii ATCC 22665]|nr:hypothetical protein H9P43_005578 [Blastocladiella emersonii ATCC 22665]
MLSSAASLRLRGPTASAAVHPAPIPSRSAHTHAHAHAHSIKSMHSTSSVSASSFRGPVTLAQLAPTASRAAVGTPAPADHPIQPPVRGTLALDPEPAVSAVLPPLGPQSTAELVEHIDASVALAQQWAIGTAVNPHTRRLYHEYRPAVVRGQSNASTGRILRRDAAAELQSLALLQQSFRDLPPHDARLAHQFNMTVRALLSSYTPLLVALPSTPSTVRLHPALILDERGLQEPCSVAAVGALLESLLVFRQKLPRHHHQDSAYLTDLDDAVHVDSLIHGLAQALVLHMDIPPAHAAIHRSPVQRGPWLAVYWQHAPLSAPQPTPTTQTNGNGSGAPGWWDAATHAMHRLSLTAAQHAYPNRVSPVAGVGVGVGARASPVPFQPFSIATAIAPRPRTTAAAATVDPAQDPVDLLAVLDALVALAHYASVTTSLTPPSSPVAHPADPAGAVTLSSRIHACAARHLAAWLAQPASSPHAEQGQLPARLALATRLTSLGQHLPLPPALAATVQQIWDELAADGAAGFFSQLGVRDAGAYSTGELAAATLGLAQVLGLPTTAAVAPVRERQWRATWHAAIAALLRRQVVRGADRMAIGGFGNTPRDEPVALLRRGVDPVHAASAATQPVLGVAWVLAALGAARALLVPPPPPPAPIEILATPRTSDEEDEDEEEESPTYERDVSTAGHRTPPGPWDAVALV